MSLEKNPEYHPFWQDKTSLQTAAMYLSGGPAPTDENGKFFNPQYAATFYRNALHHVAHKLIEESKNEP
jgi:hypothetical protein